MIDFIGALAASFVLGIIVGSRIRRLPAVIYVILFLVALVISFMVGGFPFYGFYVVRGVTMNLVFVTSFLGLIFGSILLGGVSK